VCCVQHHRSTGRLADKGGGGTYCDVCFNLYVQHRAERFVILCGKFGVESATFLKPKHAKKVDRKLHGVMREREQFIERMYAGGGE
jgi:hypothetical protein